ncbi:MAG: ComEC/Rec2 family competence protein [Anaerolineaceae bacterium]|nr:ComEC/Rec2 family competence protein [Anaerolineaceae bacterium]
MPLFWLSAAFLTGIVLAAWQPQHWPVWLGLGGFAILIGLLDSRLQKFLPFLTGWRKEIRLSSGFVLAALFIGAAWYQYRQPVLSPSDLAWYNDKGKVSLTGVVALPPQQANGAVRLRVDAADLTLLDGATSSGKAIPVHGSVLVNVASGSAWNYGDMLVLTGLMVTPATEQDTSYRDYLARQGILSTMELPQIVRTKTGAGSAFMAAVYHFQQYAYQIVNQLFPQPDAALLNGILLGLDQDLPQSLSDAFKTTGTAHIIAISGFNIAIMAGIFASIFTRLVKRRWAPLLAILGIAAYTLLVGATPSVVRAAIMGSLSLIGVQLGRRQTGINSLAFTAAVMCALNPWLPWDASFQLSFGATLGLVLFADPLQNGFIRLAERWLSSETARRIAEPVGEYFLFTLAAQIATFPVMVADFQRVSISAVIANPLALPPQPLVMILGLIALIGGMIYLPLGKLLAFFAWPLVAYTNRIVELLAKLPHGAMVLGQASPAIIGITYFFFIGITLSWNRLAWLRAWFKPTVILVTLSLAAVAVWRIALSAPDGRLHMTILPMTDGPAVLIQTPAGQEILINGGSDASDLNSALALRMHPFSPRLDALVITSQTSSPIEALPNVLDRFPLGLVLWNPPAGNQSAVKHLQTRLQQAGLAINPLVDGTALPLGSGAQLRILSSTPTGTALLLDWGNFHALIPGGVAFNDSDWADIGAKPSVLLLTKVDLSVEPVDDWSGSGSMLTVIDQQQPTTPGWTALDQHGWVQITSDGSRMWVEAER